MMHLLLRLAMPKLVLPDRLTRVDDPSMIIVRLGLATGLLPCCLLRFC